MRNDVYYVQNALPLVYNKLVVLSEEQKIATYLVSKNANSTLYNKALQNKGYVTHFAVNQHMNIWWRYLPTCLLDKEKEDDYQKVVVIREPLDRIESAFHTIGGSSIESYIDKVIYSLKNFRQEDLDRHIMSQFIQYDISKVNKFIPIQYLDKYLNSIGLDLQKVNVGKTHIKIENDELIELLQPQINLYNYIFNSNKCYKPNE